MSYGWLNISSLLFGIVALIVPITNLMFSSESKKDKLGKVLGISISACAISLCMQILYANHLVGIEDFTALMDTLPTVASISIGLFVVTISLNIATYIKYKKFTV